MQALQEIGSISGQLAAGGLGGPGSLHSEPPSPAMGDVERQGSVESALPVVRLKPVRVLAAEDAAAGGRVRVLESALSQVLFEKSSCT